MFRSISIRAVVLGLTIIVAGCAGKGSEVAHIHAPTNEQDIGDAAYMGRFLLPPQYRSSVATRYNPSSTVVAGAAVGAAGAGAPLSRAGMPNVAAVGLGLDVLGGVLDPHAAAPEGRPFISVAALPEAVSGQQIADADSATKFMQAYILARLEEWGALYGRSVHCVYRCGGDTPAYELRRIGPEHLPYFDPETLYISVNPAGGLIQASEDPLRDRILGFAPQWISKDANGFALCMDPGTKVDFEKDGALTEQKEPYYGLVANLRCRSSFTSPLERALLRILTRDGYLTLGGNFAYNHQISLKGRVYAIDTAEKGQYVRYEIDPKTDSSSLQ